MPDKKKKKEEEQLKSSTEYLRELTDDELNEYFSGNPTNIHIKGEVMRRKNKKIKERQGTIVGP